VSTDPAAGAQLPSAPAAATVVFNEQVQARADALQLHDGSGHRVDNGGLQRVNGGRGLKLPLPKLTDGGYVLTWRVVSADGHPVSGGITFRIGNGRTVAADTLQSLLSTQGGDTTLHAVAATVRTLLFAAILLLVGGVLFVLFLWPDGADDRLIRRVLTVAAVTGAVTSALSMGIEGADIAGFGLAKALSISRATDTFDAPFGKAAVIRIVLFLAAIVFVRAMRVDRVRRLGFTMLAGLGVTALMLTLSYSGHARTGRWLAVAVPLDVVHLLAAAAWIGGLGILSLRVLPKLREGDEVLVERFSTMAFVCVVIIAVTGTLQGIRQVQSLDGLRHTDYGRLLAIKVLLVVVVVLFGAMSRSIVRRGLDDRLRRSVAAESTIAVAVLVVTSLLVAANPNAAAEIKPYSALHVVQNMEIEVTAVPTHTGPVTFHIYAIDPSSTLETQFTATATLTLASRGITNLNVPLQVTGHAHWTGDNVDIPIKGTWTLTVDVTIGEFTARRSSFQIPIS
ncbi:MAG TPA: copper resistance protein CopC, partial [Mycobacteriales bacterium]|nr:copper resistance protein CopC [Mycobacteriales bacterium]